jgi:hypothetical protein
MYSYSSPRSLAGPSVTDWIGAIGNAAGQLFGPKPAPAPVPTPAPTTNYMPLILMGGAVVVVVLLLKRKKSA